MKYVALLLLLTSASAPATDVILSIKGNIYDTACEVDSASQNKVVDLARPLPVILNRWGTPGCGRTLILPSRIARKT